MDRVVVLRKDSEAQTMAQEFVADGELPEGAVIGGEEE